MSVLKKITFWAYEKDKQGFYKKKVYIQNFSRRTLKIDDSIRLGRYAI